MKDDANGRSADRKAERRKKRRPRLLAAAREMRVPPGAPHPWKKDLTVERDGSG